MSDLSLSHLSEPSRAEITPTCFGYLVTSTVVFPEGVPVPSVLSRLLFNANQTILTNNSAEHLHFLSLLQLKGQTNLHIASHFSSISSWAATLSFDLAQMEHQSYKLHGFPELYTTS
jgi:hypothetical protein